MSDGPTDDDRRRAQAHALKAKETAHAFAPYVEANRLNPQALKAALDRFAPGNDAEGDGIYDQHWLDHNTFYRFTEEYVPLEQRVAYKSALSTTFAKRGHS